MQQGPVAIDRKRRLARLDNTSFRILTADHECGEATVHDDHVEDVLTGSNGDDWFLFNKDGDGGVKDKATDMTTFESHSFEDIDWLSSGL